MSMCLILVFILDSVVSVGITAVAIAVNKVTEEITKILRGESHLRLETSGECCLASPPPPPPPPPPPHSFGVTQIDPNTHTHAAGIHKTHARNISPSLHHRNTSKKGLSLRILLFSPNKKNKGKQGLLVKVSVLEQGNLDRCSTLSKKEVMMQLHH